MAGFEVGDLVLAVNEAEVLHGIDELRGPVDHAGGQRVAPKLFRAFKLLEDLDGVGDVDGAVGFAVGRVAEFADAGVTGAGVVPAVGTFLGEIGRDLVDLDFEGRLEALEQRGEVGRHDAGADQNDIRVLDVRGVIHENDCGKISPGADRWPEECRRVFSSAVPCGRRSRAVVPAGAGCQFCAEGSAVRRRTRAGSGERQKKRPPPAP